MVRNRKIWVYINFYTYFDFSVERNNSLKTRGKNLMNTIRLLFLCLFAIITIGCDRSDESIDQNYKEQNAEAKSLQPMIKTDDSQKEKTATFLLFSTFFSTVDQKKM